MFRNACVTSPNAPDSFARASALKISALLALLMATAPHSLHAARPMITDDARTVDAKACQVESWVRSNRGSKEYWALPACNFTGNLELTLGGGRVSDAEGTRTTDIIMQGKTLLKPLETNGWGLGFAAGNARHPDRDGRLIGDLYAYVPASFSFRDDRFVLHTNVGLLREKEARRTHVTWGIGSETMLDERTYLIAEAFRQTDGRPFFQAGMRYWIVPNRVQVDATYGNRFGNSSQERWFSVGVRLLSPAFLP